MNSSPTTNILFENKDRIFLELRPEVKVIVIRKQCVTLGRDPKVYPHTKFGIPTSNNIGDMLQTQFFLELRSEVKVTVTPKNSLHFTYKMPKQLIILFVSR